MPPEFSPAGIVAASGFSIASHASLASSGSTVAFASSAVSRSSLPADLFKDGLSLSGLAGIAAAVASTAIAITESSGSGNATCSGLSVITVLASRDKFSALASSARALSTSAMRLSAYNSSGVAIRSVWFPVEFLVSDNNSCAGTSGISFPPSFVRPVWQTGAILEAGLIIADW